MRMLLCGMVLLCGCANSMRSQARVGLVNRESPAQATTGIEQTSGRDAFNVSPTLAVSGGGGALLLIALHLATSLLRSRRTLRTVISTIENLDETIGKDVKHEIAQAALAAGVADRLHRMVRTETRKARGITAKYQGEESLPT